MYYYILAFIKNGLNYMKKEVIGTKQKLSLVKLERISALM